MIEKLDVYAVQNHEQLKDKLDEIIDAVNALQPQPTRNSSESPYDLGSRARRRP